MSQLLKGSQILGYHCRKLQENSKCLDSEYSGRLTFYKSTMLDMLLLGMRWWVKDIVKRDPQRIIMNISNQIEEVTDMGAETISFQSHLLPHEYVGFMKTMPDVRDGNLYFIIHISTTFCMEPTFVHHTAATFREKNTS